MYQYREIVRQSARAVSEAANRVVEAHRHGRVQQEPAFTDRMLGRIEEAMNNLNVRGVTWQATTLTDRGHGAQERLFGADFVGILSISLPEFQVHKGFLAQSKLLRDNQALSTSESSRLREQCDKMLSLSPDAFVFLYSTRGIRIVPAISVVSTRLGNINLQRLYSRSMQRFFELHFESFIGDRTISIRDEKPLDELRETYEARRLLYLKACS